MKNVEFLGPTAFLEIDGETVARGEEITVSNEKAARLEQFSRIEVKVTDADKDADQADSYATEADAHQNEEEV